MMQIMDFDDGLAHFDDRYRLEEWLRLQIHAAGSAVFVRVQDVAPIHYKRDYTDGT